MSNQLKTLIIAIIIQDITKLKSMVPKNVLDKKVKNPDTGRQIKVTSALGYDKKSAVYRAAMNLLKKK